MFTFEDTRLPVPAAQIGHYAGWEVQIHVFYIDPDRGIDKSLVARINTAQAYCCGFNTIEYLSRFRYAQFAPEAENFWKAVKAYFMRPDGSYPGSFPVSQLFHLNNTDFEKSEIFKKGNGKRVYSYQSASEPHHLTHLYQFDLC